MPAPRSSSVGVPVHICRRSTVTLIDELRTTLIRLKGGGWEPIFTMLGLDPEAQDLREQLLKPIVDMDALRAVRGFEDLSPSATRPIDPFRPSMSVLFHALAAPGVVEQSDGSPLTEFPTPADLDLAENVVFGITPGSIASVTANLGNQSNLAVVVFAREYRPSTKTHHRNHADLVFSRTGVIRVGTLEPHWDGRSRSYSPRRGNDDPFGFRVLPARYGTYLAVQLKGDASDFGPFRFNRGFEHGGQSVDRPDDELDFWVPVHKLFSGNECLQGLTLEVSLEAHHVSEKLRRIHNANMGVPDLGGFESGFKPPETEEDPFLVTDALAAFLDPHLHGQGTLAPVVRPRLIEETILNGRRIGTRVPANERNGLAPSFNIPARGSAHPAPEWMHVRSWLRNNGSEESLNIRQNVADIVRQARIGNTDNYVAAHYSDFTGDGWINAIVGGLGSSFSRMVPAYSLIAAPDFFPYVDQSDLLDWWRTQVPTVLRREIWAVPPLTLADQRSAANINLREHGADIRPENRTPTALVGMKGSANAGRATSVPAPVQRVSTLPDAAAGIFAPGWDVSTDVTFDPTRGEHILHLAAYGLGSPFPEDAKLCAALSAFWPGVAPDSSRSAGRKIVAPLTDREVGQTGAPAWDGILGPRRVTVGNEEFFETDNFDHVDYVTTALENRFTMAETMKVSQEAYQDRVISTARMYHLIGDVARAGSDLSSIQNSFRMVSFGQGRAGDAAIASAEAQLGIQFDARACRFDMVETGATAPLVRDPADRTRWLRREKILLSMQIIIGAQNRAAFRINDGAWEFRNLIG